jgi:hypothetical protein
MMQDGDRTSLFYVARSIMKLQSIFGIIPHIKGKGSCAKVCTLSLSTLSLALLSD